MAQFPQNRHVGAESTYEGDFVSKIMVGVLGYSTQSQAARWSVWPKPQSSATGIGRTPDFMLGRFSGPGPEEFVVAGELKSPGEDLDAPQPGHNNETPVERAFFYGTHILGPRWVLVSDMRVLWLDQRAAGRRVQSRLRRSPRRYEELATGANGTAQSDVETRQSGSEALGQSDLLPVVSRDQHRCWA